MSNDRISKLEIVLDLIKPKNLINEIAPLFNIHLNYDLDDETKDYRKIERKLNAKRKSALLSLLEQQSDIKTIIDLIKKVKTPYLVADALASINTFNFDEEIYPKLLKTKDDKIKQFLYKFSNRFIFIF